MGTSPRWFVVWVAALDCRGCLLVMVPFTGGFWDSTLPTQNTWVTFENGSRSLSTSMHRSWWRIGIWDHLTSQWDVDALEFWPRCRKLRYYSFKDTWKVERRSDRCLTHSLCCIFCVNAKYGKGLKQ
jgi:hypothetical protein